MARLDIQEPGSAVGVYDTRSLQRTAELGVVEQPGLVVGEGGLAHEHGVLEGLVSDHRVRVAGAR